MLSLFEKLPTLVKVIRVISPQAILLTRVLASHGLFVNSHPSVTSGEVSIHDFVAEILQIEPDSFVRAWANHKIRRCFVSVGAGGHGIRDLLLRFEDEFKRTKLLPQIDSLILFD
jgi:hypothetical protein